jgi:hypothetical protein
MTDLVKRLRHGTAGDKERHEAADLIEKLEAEIGVLFAANVRLNSRADLDSDHYVHRIEKLEAALREMLIKCTWADTGRWCGSIDCHCRIARKALEGKND